MKAFGWALLISTVVLAAAPVRAQTPSLPPVPELKLTFPIRPLAFSFTGSEESGWSSTPLRLFRAQSLWLATPRLELVTVSASERAWELDCRLTCQPVVQTVLALEARFLLPSPTPALAAPQIFIRAATTRSPLQTQRVGLFHAGLAGAF